MFNITYVSGNTKMHVKYGLNDDCVTLTSKNGTDSLSLAKFRAVKNVEVPEHVSVYKNGTYSHVHMINGHQCVHPVIDDVENPMCGTVLDVEDLSDVINEHFVPVHSKYVCDVDHASAAMSCMEYLIIISLLENNYELVSTIREFNMDELYLTLTNGNKLWFPRTGSAYFSFNLEKELCKLR